MRRVTPRPKIAWKKLLKNYRRASGTMAEVFGPRVPGRPPPAGDAARRDQRGAVWRDQPQGAGHHRGLPRRHPPVHEGASRTGPAWAQEIHPWDVVALGRHIIWNWPMGEAAGDLQHAGLEFGKLSYRGSNEMLIGPGRTAIHAPIAIIDPHVHWYDAFRFYELRIYTPEYNASGVTILGFPLPSLGHSRYCSVAMTTGGPDTSDIFEEEINPANPKQYRYDDGWRDFHLTRGHDRRQERGEGREPARHDRLVAPWAHRGPEGWQGLRHGPSLRERGRAHRPVLPDVHGAEPRGDEAGALTSPVDVPEHHGGDRSRRHLLPQKRPRADPSPRRRSRPADPGQLLGQRVEGNSPHGRPAADREPAVRLDAELQLLARGDDEPRPAGAEPVRRSSLPLQRVSLPQLAPACRDGDRPARRR